MGFTPEAKERFTVLYTNACSAKDTMLVKIKDDMCELLKNAGEGRVKHVHCKSMAPHTKNRGGSKMQFRKIFEKGSNIMSVGISLAKCGARLSRGIRRQSDNEERCEAACGIM